MHTLNAGQGKGLLLLKTGIASIFQLYLLMMGDKPWFAAGRKEQNFPTLTSPESGLFPILFTGTAKRTSKQYSYHCLAWTNETRNLTYFMKNCCAHLGVGKVQDTLHLFVPTTCHMAQSCILLPVCAIGDTVLLR